jgi:hypothetical protein
MFTKDTNDAAMKKESIESYLSFITLISNGIIIVIATY